MRNLLFTGSATALITPFKDGAIDYNALKSIIKHQIENGTDALVVAGTTGEAPTLSDEEHIELIKFTVKEARGNIPVIAGTGSNNTAHAVCMTKKAYSVGANGILSVTPYYNKCNDDGILKHYRKIADATPLPVILYNVPSRTGYNLKTETISKLCEVSNISAVKEASGDIVKSEEIIKTCDISVYSGNDDIIVPMMSIGALGVISVISNLLPAEVKKITDLCKKGDFVKANETQIKLFPLIKSIFKNVNPIGIKYAMSLLKMCESDLRLPLCEPDDKNKQSIEEEMKKLFLI